MPADVATSSDESSDRPALRLSVLRRDGWETPLRVLNFWAVDWADQLDQEPPGVTLAGLANWLVARLEWACDNHLRIADFAMDVRAVAGSLRPYVGGDGSYPAGECPRTLPGGDLCGTPLFADPFASVFACPRCRQEWHRETGGWIKLQAQQQKAGVRVGAGQENAA